MSDESNAELLAALRRMHVMCAGFESDELSRDRVAALNYYYMRPNGTEVEGRSQAVTGDISASVEANLASMMEAFSGPNLASFDPFDSADVEQAQLESDAVVSQVMRRGGAWQLAQAIKNTLLLRNGWLDVSVTEEKRATTEEFTRVEPEAVLELTEAVQGAECEILEYDPERDGGYLRLRCVYTYKRLSAESVATENVVYQKAHDGADFEALQRIPYIARRYIETRAAAISRGFKRATVEKITEYRSDANETSAARNPRRDPSLTPGADKGSELIEWWAVYWLTNDSDGAVRREKICVDGKFEHVLQREESRVQPLCTGQAFIAPNRLTGISLFDKEWHVQDTNYALTRALLDNVEAVSKSRIAALNGKVDEEDLTDGRVNGVLRVNGSVTRVGDAVMPLVVPDASAGIITAIEHQRRLRTELGGAALEMQSAQMQLGDRVGSQGLDRAYSVAEQLSAHMVWNVAQTLVRSVFLTAHAQLREHINEPIPVNVRGDWIDANPAHWPERTELTVKPGMSPGERARLAAALDKMLGDQVRLDGMGMGDVLVNVNGFYALLMDWARNADVPNPERYYVDPRSDAARQALEERRKRAQLEQQKQEALVGQAVELEKLRTALEKYKTDTDAAIEVWQTKVEAAIEYAKLGQAADETEFNAVFPEMVKAIQEKRGQANGRAKPSGEPDSGGGAEGNAGSTS